MAGCRQCLGRGTGRESASSAGTGAQAAQHPLPLLAAALLGMPWCWNIQCSRVPSKDRTAKQELGFDPAQIFPARQKRCGPEEQEVREHSPWVSWNQELRQGMGPPAPLHCFWLLSLPLQLSHHSPGEVWSTPVCQSCPLHNTQRWVGPTDQPKAVFEAQEPNFSISVCYSQSGSSAQEKLQPTGWELPGAALPVHGAAEPRASESGMGALLPRVSFHLASPPALYRDPGPAVFVSLRTSIPDQGMQYPLLFF